jgi:hypothetical protein
MNMLQRSVLSDLKDENIYQEIVALAIIGKIITTPVMKLVDSKTFATHNRPCDNQQPQRFQILH